MSVDNAAANKVHQDRKLRAIVQLGIAPYTMDCWACGKQFNPEPAKSGPNKGQHTDSSLERAANEHFKSCKG